MIDAIRPDLSRAGRDLFRGSNTLRLALLCLALGIGLSVAAFSVVDSVLLSPMPFRAGDDLIFIHARDDIRGVESGPLTWAELTRVRRAPGIVGAEALYTRSYTLQRGDAAERVSGGVVTPGLLDLLGVTPAIGRGFVEGEGAEAGFEEVALISHGLWTRRYGGDPAALARGLTITVNERVMDVVGVMPPGFSFPDDQDVWLPLGTDDAEDAVRRYLTVIARKQAGAPLEAVRAEIAPIPGRIDRADQVQLAEGDRVLAAHSLRDEFIPAAARRFLPLLLAGVALLLLVACANVANLLLARSLDRDRETMVRKALGAGRGRLAGELLAEIGLVALIAAAAGLGMAWWWLAAANGRLPDAMPYWIELGISPLGAAFVVAVTVMAAALSAGLPVLRLLRLDPAGALRSRRGGSRGSTRARTTLLAGEVAMSLVLLVGAGVFIRSFVAMTTEDVGFDDDDVMSARVILSGDAYDFPAIRLAYYGRALAAVESAPGVAAAVATTAIPATDAGPSRDVQPAGDATRTATASLIGSSHGFFQTLGIPLLAGRAWTRGEAMDTAAGVAVLGESLARRLWPDGVAVDREIEVERLGLLRVVGVAADVQYGEVGTRPLGGLQLHVPLGLTPGRGMAILARVDAATPDAATPAPGAVRTPIAGAVRTAIAGADPTQAPYDVRALHDRRAADSAIQRTFASLFTEIGVLALLLALAGVYGTMAYEVRRRSHELGVRMALGATAGRILRHVLGRTGAVTAAGIALGLLGILAAGGTVRGLLYGVTELDPLVLAGVSGAVLLAAILAALVPAVRAMRVEPVEVLRGE